MRVSTPAVLALVLAAFPGAVHADPAITDLAVRLADGQVLASCRLDDGLAPGMEEEIAAGMEVTIEYRVQVCRRRGGFPDSVRAKRRVACTVRHDTLTRQYTMTRRIDGEISDTRVTADAAEVRDFLTRLRDVPVMAADRLDPDGRHYLRAKADLGLVWRFYLIPWPLNTGWARRDLGTSPGTLDAGQP